MNEADKKAKARATRKAYYLAHKEQFAAAGKARRAANPLCRKEEYARAVVRAPEKIKARQDAYVERNRDKVRATKKAWRERNPNWREPYYMNKKDDVLTLVYVIEAEKYIKVGIAEDMVNRFLAFKTHCPLPMTIVFCSKLMPRKEASRIERACHNHLAAHNVSGEWFETSSGAAIAFIETMTQRADAVVNNDPVQLRLVS